MSEAGRVETVEERKMSASVNINRLFRETHRAARLRPWVPGQNEAEDVRALRLTPALEKIINIKDTFAQTLHEDRIVGSAPSLSQN